MGKASLLYNKLLCTVYIYDYIDLSFLYISCMYIYSYAWNISDSDEDEILGVLIICHITSYNSHNFQSHDSF